MSNLTADKQMCTSSPKKSDDISDPITVREMEQKKTVLIKILKALGSVPQVTGPFLHPHLSAYSLSSIWLRVLFVSFQTVCKMAKTQVGVTELRARDPLYSFVV